MLKIQQILHNLQMIRTFLDLMDLYCHDVILKSNQGPAWYQESMRETTLTNDVLAKLIITIQRQKELCTRFNDQNLLTAQIYQKLEDFFHDVK